MNVIILPFSELSAKQMYDIAQLRQDVFIIEQNCIYADLDGMDNQANHLMIYEGNILLAYSRLFSVNLKHKNATSIGRIIVHKSKRRTEVGPKLIKCSLDWCLENFPNTTVYIEAQAALKEYYRNFGFIEEGEVYSVDDIPHLKMYYYPL